MQIKSIYIYSTLDILINAKCFGAFEWKSPQGFSNDSPATAYSFWSFLYVRLVNLG